MDAETLHMVEAIAWWRLQLPDGRGALSRAATDLIVAGKDGAGVLEMASVYPDESGATIDRIVENVILELDLVPALLTGNEVLAVRRMCRMVLADLMAERELSGWVHSSFHHQSDDERLNELALLDDEYDDVDARGSQAGELRRRIRDLAQQILE